tara:strand:- start:3320 stop:3835 length:516 start_codon:yes stop_codon:yes gene_type:complete
MYDFENVEWKKNNTSVVNFIYIDNENSKIYKKFKNNSSVKNLKNIYKKINKFDFVPRMEFFDEENIIVEEYFKNKLTISNKPFDYIYQLLNINKTLKKNSIYHNDYKLIHFYVKDGKIKLIDWNCVTFGSPLKNAWANNNITYYIIYYSQDKILIFVLITILLFIYLKKLK